VSFKTRFYISLVIAIISGALTVDFFYVKLGSGDTSVWMYAIASLIVFVVSALAATYYKGRKNDIQDRTSRIRGEESCQKVKNPMN
jgi:phosphoglycerol transferase MdoB-like AlkP superfamily enzyme